MRGTVAGRCLVAVLPMVLVGALLTSGCADPRVGPNAPSRATASVTVTVTSTTIVAAKQTDISSWIQQVRDYVSGALWNNGRVPGATSTVHLDADAVEVTGRLTYSQSVGRSSYRRVQTLQAQGIGDPSIFEMTTRSGSTDPDTVVDVLHRSGNPGHDYLLTGAAYRVVAPTAWLTVPAQFGNGLGCTMPGRQVVCEVTADLLANQKLDPSMPTNSAATSAGAGSISSAITVRQLLALDVWQLRTEVAPAVVKATAAELDRTLIPVTLSYDVPTGSAQGRPTRLRINAAVTVGGIAITIDLGWDETASGSVKEIALPVPTKALYTVLTADQRKQLAVISARGE